MNVTELAKKKISLQQRLDGIGMVNVASMSVEDRISLETASIETRRELQQIETQIRSYIERGTA